ncbi:hypothetical protein [Rheinheimera sp.]|uniref:hypothetical protein n=1 Tax=Rheinheimera sp. TaxID=1869214 RepID=UPI0025DA47E5|nr:hypothetical protein [Rheinheimera sp.]
MDLKEKLALSSALVAVLVVGSAFLFRGEDTVILRLQNWSTETSFQVARKEPESLSIPSKGNLGAFYKCMSRYFDGSERNSGLPVTGRPGYFSLVLDENTEMKIGFVSTQAGSFTIYTRDSSGKITGASLRYAISCDHRLLNTPESDMHCVDKVIGNEIRPVCTYQPKQL